MSMKDQIVAWQTWQYAQSLSARTVTDRASTIQRMANWTGHCPTTATTAHIVTWLAEGGDWAATTRSTYHGHLTAWYTWLQKMGHRADNPMATVGKPRRPRAEPRPITDHALTRLLATRMRKRTRVMILLAALTGMRVHEIAKVRGEHIDLHARTIRVTGKGGHTAHLPLHPLIVDAAHTMPRRGWWFPTNATRDGHILAASVGTILKEAMVRAGVDGSAHQLRHYFGTTLVATGTDLRTAQDLLRHASLATTQIYTKVADLKRVEAIDRLDPYGHAA